LSIFPRQNLAENYPESDSFDFRDQVVGEPTMQVAL